MAAALLGVRTDGPDDRYARRLAEALWIPVVRFRPEATGNRRGKSHVTDGAADHFVRENLARPIDREEVARFLRISPSHVTRLFLRFAGELFGG